MPRAYPEDPDHVADRQARFRARRAEREQRLRNTQERAREAFSDVLKALIRAAAAYEELAGTRDDAYRARLTSYQTAIERGRKAYADLFARDEPVEKFE